MFSKPHTIRAAVATALAAAIGFYLSGIGPSREDARAEELSGKPGRSVTLPTGDRVLLPADGAAGPTIEPAAGRRDMKFVVSRVAGHLQVVPVDALERLGSGRLDPRLFDVTGSPAPAPIRAAAGLESYDVTLSHLDRTGTATGAFGTVLVNLDSGDFLSVPPAADGVATLRLPAGRYLLRSVVATPLPDGTTESSLLVQPVLDPAADRRVSLDARLARPVDARPQRASAVSAQAAVTIAQQTGTVGFMDVLWGSDFRGMSTARIGPDRPAPGFSSTVVADYAEPGPDGDFTNSPYLYHLAWVQPGTLPTGFRRTVADRDLAKVIAAHAAAAPDSFSVSSANPAGGGVVYGFPLRGPFTQTEFYTSAPDLRWSSSFIAVAGEQFDQTLRLSAGPRELIAGRTYRETWNQAVLSPSLAAPPEKDWYVSRTADRFFMLLPQFADGAGHRGFSTLAGERYTLYRDGVKVAELADPSGEPGWSVPLPPESSAYRLEADVRRGPGTPLSAHVVTAWTFRSGHAAGEEPVRLPLSVVRFAPALDELQRAPAGRPFEMPITVERQPGSAGAPTARLTVEVSYDDRAWHPVPLTRAGSGWTGHLDHPRDAGFVSLRSKATDTEGNTVEQTITHAYATR